MSAHFNLRTSRVAIAGLGLMGGSLAMALKGHCEYLAAYDPDNETVELARQMKVADRVDTQLEAVIPGAELILLAAPVKAIISLIEQLPQLEQDSAVVIDIGSTKKRVCAAMSNLPQGFDPLGGHPMCGKATAGLAHAQPDLFHKATFAFTPLERTSARAIEAAKQIAAAIGAEPFWIDADTHDRWVATTSHLPYMLSIALSLTVPVEAAPLVGPGFRSSSRLASSSRVMMEDILETNRENLIRVLQQLQRNLHSLESALVEEDISKLRELMSLGATHHAALTSSK